MLELFVHLRSGTAICPSPNGTTNCDCPLGPLLAAACALCSASSSLCNCLANAIPSCNCISDNCSDKVNSSCFSHNPTSTTWYNVSNDKSDAMNVSFDERSVWIGWDIDVEISKMSIHKWSNVKLANCCWCQVSMSVWDCVFHCCHLQWYQPCLVLWHNRKWNGGLKCVMWVPRIVGRNEIVWLTSSKFVPSAWTIPRGYVWDSTSIPPKHKILSRQYILWLESESARV